MSLRVAGEDPPPGEIPPSTRRRSQTNDNVNQEPPAAAQPDPDTDTPFPIEAPSLGRPYDETTIPEQNPTALDYLEVASQFSSVDSISTSNTNTNQYHLTQSQQMPQYHQQNSTFYTVPQNNTNEHHEHTAPSPSSGTSVFMPADPPPQDSYAQHTSTPIQPTISPTPDVNLNSNPPSSQPPM